MKYLFLPGLLMSASVALATPAAPADTLPGHRHLVHSLSATLCTELSSSQAPNLDKMASPAVLEYTQGLFVKAMMRDSVQLRAMMQLAAAQNMQPVEVGRLLGRDAMLEVSRSCPAALSLAVRLARTEQGQQSLATQQPKLPAAEQKALLPVAIALCTALKASNARAPFSKLTPAGRKQAFMSAMQKAFKPNTAALNRFYGPAKLDALLRSGEFDGRVASFMLSQNICAEYLLLIGQDRLAEGGKP